MVEGSMTYQELLSVLVTVELQISFTPSCMYACWEMFCCYYPHDHVSCILNGDLTSPAYFCFFLCDCGQCIYL